MSDEKVENERPEQQTEASDIKETRELFERLGKLKLPDLLAGIEKGFYVNACGAIELFEKICLNAPSQKKRLEAAKYLLSFLKDPNFIKNMALVHELRGRLSKDAATADNKATWKTEPKQE